MTYTKQGGLLGFFVALCLCSNIAAAQAPSDTNIFQQAQGVARAAQDAYVGQYNSADLPLWREAIQLGEQALAQAPNDPERIRFMARTYSQANWFSRAWDQWLNLANLTGTISNLSNEDPASTVLFSRIGSELGSARYQINDAQGAINYYNTVISYLPNDIEALTWLGRIYFETAQPEQALSYWQTLTQVNPEDTNAVYFLSLTQEQLEYGISASQNFQAGRSAYERRNLTIALGHFEDAVDDNPEFLDAVLWAARSSFELEQPRLSRAYWQRALELDPSDERSQYFLEISEQQVAWGIEAANAFNQGIELYDADNKPEAVRFFEDATEFNDSYTDAFVWTARSYQELEQPDDAIPFWERVLELNPEDDRAEYFLSLAKRESEYGVAAARAFTQGFEDYQKGNVQQAQDAFFAAIQSNPAYVEAWGWLGRLYFERAEYRQSANLYRRALEFDANNDGYKFFFEEATRLAEKEAEEQVQN